MDRGRSLGRTGAGAAVGQCADEVVALLGAPQAIAADGTECVANWRIAEWQGAGQWLP